MTDAVSFVGLDLGTRFFGVSTSTHVGSLGTQEHNSQITVPKRLNLLSEKLIYIRDTIVDIVSPLRMGKNPQVFVGVEAVMSHGGFYIVLAGEIHGVIRVALKGILGLELIELPLSTCRSTLLGSYRKETVDRYGGIKNYIYEVVRHYRPGIGPDAADAFVVANHLRATHGFGFLRRPDGFDPPIPEGCRPKDPRASSKKPKRTGVKDK
jgi:hypothetical protein